MVKPLKEIASPGQKRAAKAVRQSAARTTTDAPTCSAGIGIT
jgi:hypothetical protein